MTASDAIVELPVKVSNCAPSRTDASHVSPRPPRPPIDRLRFLPSSLKLRPPNFLATAAIHARCFLENALGLSDSNTSSSLSPVPTVCTNTIRPPAQKLPLVGALGHGGLSAM